MFKLKILERHTDPEALNIGTVIKGDDFKLIPKGYVLQWRRLKQHYFTGDQIILRMDSDENPFINYYPEREPDHRRGTSWGTMLYDYVFRVVAKSKEEYYQIIGKPQSS